MTAAAPAGEWAGLASSYEVSPMLTATTWQELQGAYLSPSRHYHTLRHVATLLDYAQTFRQALPDYDAVRFAIWFHDAVYDSQANNNEEKSAEYADAYLNKLNIPITTINQVVMMILNTKNHLATTNDIDSQILLDADLSILGSEESEYKKYAQAIRREYSWVTDAAYRIGRKRVLESFLQRNRLYFTDQAFQMLELKARKNITAELLNL